MRFALSHPPHTLIHRRRREREGITAKIAIPSPSLLFDPNRPKSSLLQIRGGIITHKHTALRGLLRKRFPTHRDTTNTHNGAAPEIGSLEVWGARTPGRRSYCSISLTRFEYNTGIRKGARFKRRIKNQELRIKNCRKKYYRIS